MSSYVWEWPERRDLYLASRVLADEKADGDWLQWAADTLLCDLELYDDPQQGVGSWLAADEAEHAKELGIQLQAIVHAAPFHAAECLIREPSGAVRSAASSLAALLEANGRSLS